MVLRIHFIFSCFSLFCLLALASCGREKTEISSTSQAKNQLPTYFNTKLGVVYGKFHTTGIRAAVYSYSHVEPIVFFECRKIVDHQNPWKKVAIRLANKRGHSIVGTPYSLVYWKKVASNHRHDFERNVSYKKIYEQLIELKIDSFAPQCLAFFRNKLDHFGI